MIGVRVLILVAIPAALASNATDPKNRLDERTFGFFDSGVNMRNIDADYEKPIDYLVQSKGYPFEKHYVTTEDGYIITMHRIPHGRNVPNPGTPNRKVAVLGAPLLTLSTIWVMDMPNNSFAFILADRGYDVWLANCRGSSFGKHHTNLTIYDSQFWHFTLIDIGAKDLAAQIDYALKVSGREQVYYAGMSQGGASLYALLAKRPDYNKKIRAMAALATFRRVCHINIWWMNAGSTLENYIGRFPIMEVLPKVSMLGQGCDMADNLCLWYTKYFLYTDVKYLNTSRIPVYMSHFPSGTSKMNLFYYSQIMQESQCEKWNEVREYDYDRSAVSRSTYGGNFFWNVFGETKRINPQMYDGSLEPPIMDPNNIHIPIKLYWSDGDRYAPPQEQAFLKKELKSIVAEFHIADQAWGHYSFGTSPYNASVFLDAAKFFDDCSVGEEYCTYRP
ncbi:lipase member J-like [Galendromus occidentalis]|uniref:Lipase member J-like n=1 Tax=Galendromus occidentalis TaxID=34638 RepID=A0AAJ6QMB0_9ACAR|nr:lipase member J-like [Galendromus occidentalis]